MVIALAYYLLCLSLAVPICLFQVSAPLMIGASICFYKYHILVYSCPILVVHDIVCIECLYLMHEYEVISHSFGTSKMMCTVNSQNKT
jgi:hypothetical protein